MIKTRAFLPRRSGGDRGNPKAQRLQRSNSRGFSLVELLLVVVIISILAAIVQPNLHQALLKARAADVVGELNLVKVAVLSYQSDHLTWPPDRNRGQIPPGLEDYLPDGFSFTNPDYVLDYDNWTGTGAFDVGVTFISTDLELGRAVLDLLGASVWTDGSTKYTWVISG